MKRINIFKTVFLLTAFLLSYVNLKAQCDIRDDLNTLTTNQVFQPHLTTASGWNIMHAAVSQGGTTNLINALKMIGSDETTKAVVLNGGGPTITGSITSPTLLNGCDSISFKYGYLWKGENVKMEIRIAQNGNIVWRDTLINTTLYARAAQTYSKANIGIAGDFVLSIINLCPSGTNYTEYGVLQPNGSYIGGSPNFSDCYFVWNICLTNYIPIPRYNYQFNVPKDATIFVGDKDQTVTVAGNYLTKHYVPFTKKDEVFILETDTSRIWYYDLPAPKNASGGFNYRISREGSATQVGLFKPKTGTTVEKDTALTFTNTQLSAHSPQEIDHNVTHLAGRNVADVFMNINAQGYLTLPLQADTAFQLIHTRNWQVIDTDVNNYFIEPDFHYTVLDENGQPSADVVSVSDSGVIRPVGAGTAIVLVDYDAMVTRHTTNLGLSADSLATHGALFSKLWAENTGVFVVSVAQPEAGITTNMNLNAYWAQDGTDKTDGVAIDAEHDIMYFDAAQGSFPYTFTPAGATQVLIATPTVGEKITSFSGFRTDSVTVNGDGSYTIKLGFGRNIVKLVSASGATYQVITAKPVTYTVSNLTHPEQAFVPGDEVSVLFNTLYHPANKMSGIYNMSAGIQYSSAETNFPLILGPGQYTFASRAQEYKITIPDTLTANDFVLEKGVIKVKGFGSYYGAHRKITIQNGVNPNLNASVREAYFGALPDIHIPVPSNNTAIATVTANSVSVYPNPFTDYIIVDATENGTAQIFDLSGKIVLNTTLTSGKNQIATSTLSKGIYLLKVDGNTVKLVK